MRVDEYIVECDAFTLQRLENEVVDRPESVLWKGIGTEAILIADHHKIKVKFLTDESEVAEHALDKLQLLKAVDLLVCRLLNQGAVAVDE